MEHLERPTKAENDNILTFYTFGDKLCFIGVEQTMGYEKELHDLFLMQQAYGTLFSLINKLQITGDTYFTGLTSRQFMTIVAILHLPEDETTINNIARKLGTSKQNANRMVTGIEKLGYVTIVPSSKDRRATNVLLTDAGKQKVLECSQYAVDFMADLFRSFNTQELETLWNLLHRLYEFDGNRQDGFEEDSSKLISDPELSDRILQHFAEKRKYSE